MGDSNTSDIDSDLMAGVVLLRVLLICRHSPESLPRADRPDMSRYLDLLGVQDSED